MIARAVLLSVVLGLVGVGVTFWLLGEELASLTRIPVWALLAGVALLLLNYLCGGLRIVLLTRVLERPIDLWRSTRAYILGLFSSAVTPGGSGQAPATVLALIRDGLAPAESMSVTVYVWVLDLFFLAWSVPVGLMVLSRGSGLLDPGTAALVALAAGGAFLFSWYVLAYRLRALRGTVARLFTLRWLRRWQRGAIAFVDRTAAATALMTRRGPGLQLTLHALTATLYLATYTIFVVLIRSLGSDAGYATAVAAVLLPSVLSFIFPTPGGAGLLELAAASLFSVQQGPGSVGAALFAWRLITFYTRFVTGPALGGTVLLRRVRAERSGGAGEGGDPETDGGARGEGRETEATEAPSDEPPT